MWGNGDDDDDFCIFFCSYLESDAGYNIYIIYVRDMAM